MAGTKQIVVLCCLNVSLVDRFESNQCGVSRKTFFHRVSPGSSSQAGWPRRGFERLGGRATRGSQGDRSMRIILLFLRAPDVQSRVWGTSPLPRNHPANISAIGFPVARAMGRPKGSWIVCV